VAAKLIGFKTIFMACFELREKVMDALSAISGNRVNYGMNRIGGVNRDVAGGFDGADPSRHRRRQ